MQALLLPVIADRQVIRRSWRGPYTLSKVTLSVAAACWYSSSTVCTITSAGTCRLACPTCASIPSGIISAVATAKPLRRHQATLDSPYRDSMAGVHSLSVQQVLSLKHYLSTQQTYRACVDVSSMPSRPRCARCPCALPIKTANG